METYGKTENGIEIYNASKLGCHCHRPDLAKEVLSKIKFDGGFKIFVVDLGRVIGIDHCIKTNDYDKIIFMTRGNRRCQSRMVLNKKAEPTSKVTIILCSCGKEDGQFAGKNVIVTLYEGDCAPKEPWDNFNNEKEKNESIEFWSTHALVPTDEEWEIIKKEGEQ